MQLINRKRINNLPRYNTGFDQNNLSQMMQGVTRGGIPSFVKQPDLSSMDYIRGAISNMKTPSEYTSNFGSKKLSFKDIFNASTPLFGAVGDMFSQSNKFTDSTSNDLRQYGGILSKVIPGKYGEMAGKLFDIAGDTVGMYNYHHNQDDMMNQVGTTERQINGIGYTQQNDINTSSSYNDVKSTGTKNAISTAGKGALIGSIGGPVGTVIGGVLGGALGLFGGRRAAIRQGRINRNAVRQTSLINAQSKSYANTQGLMNNYYADNGDTTGDILYANRGKDLKLRKRINNNRI